MTIKKDNFSEQTQVGYFYNKQIRSIVKQFQAIFASLQIKVGENPNIGDERHASVPVIFGEMDRVVAHILAGNTQNKMLRIPMMSVEIADLIPSPPEYRKGRRVESREMHLPRGGSVPEDLKTIHQINPVPLKMQLNLGIHTSNMSQRFQILEQIFLLFDPDIELYKNDEVHDLSMLQSAEIIGFNPDRAFPAGADRRICNDILNFSVRAYISAPVDIRRDFITKIIQNVSVVAEGKEDVDIAQYILDFEELEFPEN